MKYQRSVNMFPGEIYEILENIKDASTTLEMAQRLIAEVLEMHPELRRNGFDYENLPSCWFEVDKMSDDATSLVLL